MHAGHPTSFGRRETESQPAPMSPEDTRMDQTSEGEASPDQEDASRGRRRNRGSGDEGDGERDEDGTTVAGSSKKRRRSRKGLDKKFECPHEGCGKSYSRAEHLYRHQLNRTSTIFLIIVVDALRLNDNVRSSRSRKNVTLCCPCRCHSVTPRRQGQTLIIR